MNTAKLVAQLDSQGLFLGETMAHESPLEPGVWLIPAGAIDEPAPEIPEGQQARWVNNAWTFETIPAPVPEPEIQTPEEDMSYAAQRRRAYPSIYDYIDGVVKGDQAQIDAYIAASLAAKAQYPKG